jgi:glycosyltransferase involved in cell wall biosynthesis
MLVAPSAAFAAATARCYALPAPPRVVHNGRSHPISVPPRPMRLPADFAFTTGRLWDEGKNARVLEEVAARLPLPFLAAGPLAGPNGARFAPHRLQCLGQLDPVEIAACLSARPIFVSLARYEPFGLSVLEAAQAGCALVLSDIAGFREIWGDAAIFVAPDDAAGAAAAAARLAADPALRDRAGRAARARAARYGAASMTEGMAGLYGEMLGQPALQEALR